LVFKGTEANLFFPRYCACGLIQSLLWTRRWHTLF